MLLSPTRHFWPHPSACSHPAGMLWEPLPRGADPGEHPSCHPPFHCPSFADRLSWGRWPGGHHWWVCPPSIFMWTDRTPRDRQLLPPSLLLLLPKPPYFSSPATSSQLSSSPHLHPHLCPLKDLDLPGLNMTDLPIALPVVGLFPLLSPLAPHCPFAHT